MVAQPSSATRRANPRIRLSPLAILSSSAFSLACVSVTPFPFMLGCANPGSPQPPSLHLPSLARGVAAERVGNQVQLTWSNPPNTTDGDAIRLPATAVICREPVPTPSRPSLPGASSPRRNACAEIQRIPAAPGPARATDPLPVELSSGLPGLLAYRVELLNARQRSAGLSAPAFVASGAGPAPAGPLAVVARRAGALVTWHPETQPRSADAGQPHAIMELKRTQNQGPADLLTPPPSSPVLAGRRESMQPFKKTKKEAAKTSPSEVVLRGTPLAPSANAAPKTSGDGLIDRTVKDGDTYTYIAQRVLSLEIGGHAVELRGLPSPPATFTFRNRFPPQPPVGLVSVPSAGFGAPQTIDLSWEPSLDDDLAGYNLYRSENTAIPGPTPFVRLNPEPIPRPAFRDSHVMAGHIYLYRVTAIDQRGNESAASAVIRETIMR